MTFVDYILPAAPAGRVKSAGKSGLVAILIVVAVAQWLIGLNAAHADEAADLIAGIVSRSQAISSGQIQFRFRSESFVGDSPAPPLTLPEVTTTFSKSSWAERKTGGHRVQINHDGYFLEFVQTPQHDGSLRPGATLFPQRLLESRKEFNAPPLFAGSFWHREQLSFVQEHAAEFRIAGSQDVHSIPTTVLELDVAADAHRAAFHVLLPELKHGGLIRLYVAPQLGFVLPRIELVTPLQQVAQSYDAIDFSEVATGVYLPARVRTETHAAGGSSRYRGEFSIRYDRINQVIPEEAFLVDLPIGTRVQDARQPGSVVHFRLTEPSSSARLASLSAVGEAGSHSPLLGRWQGSIILGILVGSVGAISLLLAAREQRSRARPL